MQFNTDLNRENFLSNLIEIYSLFQREKKRYFERISQHIYISSVPKKKRERKKKKSSKRVIIDSVFEPRPNPLSSSPLSSPPFTPFPSVTSLVQREFFAKRAQAESVALITFVID